MTNPAASTYGTADCRMVNCKQKDQIFWLRVAGCNKFTQSSDIKRDRQDQLNLNVYLHILQGMQSSINE